MADCTSASVGLGTYTCPNHACEPWCGSGEEGDDECDGEEDPQLGCSNREDGPPECPAGNPVSIASGNKYQKETDFTSSGPSGISIERHYNSSGGKGTWRFSYRQKLLVEEHNGNQVLVSERADGSQLRYVLTNGEWQSWADVTARLAQQLNADGEVTGRTLSFDDQTVEHYSADGDLLKITRPWGSAIELSYSKNSAGETTAIAIESMGVSVSYQLTGDQIDSVSTVQGDIRYEYDTSENKNLVRIVFPDTTADDSDNPARQYQYSNTSFPSALTGIVDETGILFAQWEYDDQGRAIKSWHAADADTTTLDFTFADDASDPRTTVTNSLGKQTTYHFESINGKKRVTLIEGHQSENCVAANRVKTYDDNGFVASIEDWNGNITRFERDARGREIKRTEAAGTPAERSIITQWHATLNLPVQVTEGGRSTHYEYDAAGRVTATRVTKIQSAQ